MTEASDRRTIATGARRPGRQSAGEPPHGEKGARLRIDFIGLGNVDGPMALSVVKAGHALATELGREYDVPRMLAALAEPQLDEAPQRGWGDRDSNAIFCLQEERAGVELRTGNGRA